MFVRIVKVAIIGLAASLFLGVTLYSYTFHLSPDAREGKRNQTNLTRVRVGMSQREALSIAGPPKSVRPPFHQKGGVVYEYTTPPLASSELRILIGPDSLVRAVGLGD